MYFRDKLYTYSTLFVIFIALVSFVFTFHFINWPNNHPFTNDINQYYSYLNGLFIEHDLTFKTNVHEYWLIETPIHKYVPKVTYGIAFFYSPFYLIAKLLSNSNASGYEPIFAWFVHFGCIIYILAGLWFTRKTLLFWFNELVTSVVILLLFFGTNLFYYTVSESESVHGILFFLISVFIHYVIKWNYSNSKIDFFVFVICAGFICLIRPTEGLVLMFPILIGVTDKNSWNQKLKQIIGLKVFLILGLLIFMLPLLPQLIYWKIQSGSYLFFSYGTTERFFWNDPQIVNVFFSFRKGFFIYTPIMIFSVLGFYHMYKEKNIVFYSSLFYFLLNVYLVSSWWDWSYGGSFGMRSFIHCFSILAVPFAFFIKWVISLYKKSILKTIIFLFVVSFSVFACGLNLLQSNLYKHQIIHYDGMNKKAYMFTFCKKKYTQEELNYLTTLFKSPDYEARRKGDRDE